MPGNLLSDLIDEIAAPHLSAARRQLLRSEINRLTRSQVINNIFGSGPGSPGASLYENIVLHHAGAVQAVYLATSANLTIANAAAVSGDVIYLPLGTFTSAVTFTAGVRVIGLSRWGTILSGQVTVGEKGSLANMTLRRSGLGAALIVPATVANFYLLDCDVMGFSTVSAAYGLQVAAGVVDCFNCRLRGASSSGSSWGVYRMGGTVNVYGGLVSGSTDPFNTNTGCGGVGYAVDTAAIGSGIEGALDPALTNLLKVYWKMDEASGTRADSVGTATLSPTNAPGSAAGKISLSAQFVSASSQSLSMANYAPLNLGADTPFTVACWVYLDSKTAEMNFVSPGAHTGSYDFDFSVAYKTTSDRLLFSIASAAANGFVNADTLGSPATAAWFFIACWYDNVAKTINIQINDGGIDSAAWATGTHSVSGNFFVGAEAGTVNFMDGRIDEMGIWHRVLTAGERTSLFNSGAGLTYPF